MIIDSDTNWEQGEAMWRGFSKQNAFKSHLHNRLNLKTLDDALMRISIFGLEVCAMDWATILNIWRNLYEGYLRSIDSLFLILFCWGITNQDCILFILYISFPKILCKPKLRSHFGVKCRCQLTFIFAFKNATWHFGSEVECQVKLIKHTHWSSYQEPN